MQQPALPVPDICAVVLAGGQSRRMGGHDKALLPLAGWPLIAHVIAALRPQVANIIVNSNRHPDSYAPLGLPVIADIVSGQPGPLGGMLTALHACNSEYVLIVPCDTPHLPADLAARMYTALQHDQAEVCTVDDGTRLHPVVVLLHRSVLPSLEHYFRSGQRRVQEWLHSLKHTTVDYSDMPDAFVNVNTPAQLHALEQDGPVTTSLYSTPLLALVARSGTGKTTLLERLIPLLRDRGLRVAVLKHSHHDFDIDQPGKDSYRLRQAGARQVMVASRRRWALMTEVQGDAPEPDLTGLLPTFDHRHLDLILLEGFKHEAVPKIELRRSSLDGPALYPSDPWVMAVATDTPEQSTDPLPALDISDPESIAGFIVEHVLPAARNTLDTPPARPHNDSRPSSPKD